MPAFLETERLVLRAFTAADADHLYELNSDPEVMWFLSGGQPTPREEVRDRIIPFFLSFYERYEGLGFWAAQTRAAGDFLGWFHLRPAGDGSVDLGYRLRRAAWNQGYATEGSRALIRKCFTDLGVRRVVAHTMAVNQRSRRVLEKCGLTLARSYHSAGVPGTTGVRSHYGAATTQWGVRRCGNDVVGCLSEAGAVGDSGAAGTGESLALTPGPARSRRGWRAHAGAGALSPRRPRRHRRELPPQPGPGRRPAGSR